MDEPQELTDLIVKYDYDSGPDTSLHYGDADGADGTEIILRGHMPPNVFEVIGRCVPDLRYLSIFDPAFDPAMLSLLPDGIQWLILEAKTFEDAAVNSLKRFRELSELSLAHTGMSEAGWKTVGELGIRDLGIQCDSFRSDYIQLLANLPLEKLKLTNLKLDDGAFASLSNEQLKSLILRQCQFDGYSGVELSRFTSLEHVWLGEADLAGDSFSQLELHHIRRFVMSATTYMPELMWRAVCQMHSMSRLEFSHVAISDLHIVGLSDLPNLEHIDVRTTDVTRDGVRAFLETTKSSPYVYALGFNNLSPFTKEDLP